MLETTEITFPIEIPFKDFHLELIRAGMKWYTLRSLKYDYYPYEKRLLNVPHDLTDEIVKGEGYESKEQLIKALKRMRHRFPKQMWLYDLRRKVSPTESHG